MKNNNYREGKKCYTNGIICKYLLPEQIPIYEKQGFYKGTLRKPLTDKQKENISIGTKKGMNNDIVLEKLHKAAIKNANKNRFLKNRRYNWHTKTPAEEYISPFLESLDFIYQRRTYVTKYKEINNKAKNFYVPDFVNLEYKIIIEFDGKSHTSLIKDYDLIRTKALNYYGYEVFRFKNNEVYKEEFKNTILNIVSKRKLVMIKNDK